MPINEISNVNVLEVDGEQGPGVAITIALDIANPATLADFIPQVVEAFKTEHHDTPRANILLISILGDLSADEFARQWHELNAPDTLLAEYFESLDHADVIQGTPDGALLSSASLLETDDE